MSNYTTGKVFEKGPIVQGTSDRGTVWQRMTLVIEVAVGQYTKKLAFQVTTGNVPGVMAFNVGDKVEVGWDIVSREYTNKEGVRSWFTQADLRSIKAADEDDQTAQSAPIGQNVGEPQSEDLPF